MRKLALAAALVALVGSPITAGATIIPLIAYIDGLQETPPVATPATGSASITYDDVSNLLSWTISFSGLIGTINNAHFHGPAPVGTPAGVRVGIPFTSGLTADTLVGAATITEAFETELLAGLWYINIHSTFKPGGEIRGQVVPEPTTAALLVLGVGGIAFARRQRV